jgi:hypothetical protein
VVEMLALLRDGADVEEDEPGGPALPRDGADVEEDEPGGQPTPEGCEVPNEILTLLRGPLAEELRALARAMLRRDGRRVVFHTPVGDIRCPVTWVSHTPGQLGTDSRLILMHVNAKEAAFTPNVGTTLELSFENFPRRELVLCLSAPITIYPGVDLLCFLPYSSPAMEKNGKTQEKAPSALSGEPSDRVDSATGEPLAGDESIEPVSLRDYDKIRKV